MIEVQTIKAEVCPLDEAAFGEAYRSGLSMTFRFLKYIGAPSSTAEELSQAAWARGWQYRKQLADPTLVGTWVNSIARNLYWSEMKRERRFMELSEVGEAFNINDSVDAAAILNSCSVQESRMLQMFYIDGFSVLEIAEREQLCPTTFRVRMMRLRRKVRDRFVQVDSRVN